MNGYCGNVYVTHHDGTSTWFGNFIYQGEYQALIKRAEFYRAVRVVGEVAGFKNTDVTLPPDQALLVERLTGPAPQPVSWVHDKLTERHVADVGPHHAKVEHFYGGTYCFTIFAEDSGMMFGRRIIGMGYAHSPELAKERARQVLADVYPL